MPYWRNLSEIHCSQRSWASLFMVRGPKSHCCWQKWKAESAENVGPTACSTADCPPVALCFTLPQPMRVPAKAIISILLNLTIRLLSAFSIMLYLRHDAQEVAAPDFLDVALVVAVAQQLASDGD